MVAPAGAVQVPSRPNDNQQGKGCGYRRDSSAQISPRPGHRRRSRKGLGWLLLSLPLLLPLLFGWLLPLGGCCGCCAAFAPPRWAAVRALCGRVMGQLYKMHLILRNWAAPSRAKQAFCTIVCLWVGSSVRSVCAGGSLGAAPPPARAAPCLAGLLPPRLGASARSAPWERLRRRLYASRPTGAPARPTGAGRHTPPAPSGRERRSKPRKKNCNKPKKLQPRCTRCNFSYRRPFTWHIYGNASRPKKMKHFFRESPPSRG